MPEDAIPKKAPPESDASTQSVFTDMNYQVAPSSKASSSNVEMKPKVPIWVIVLGGLGAIIGASVGKADPIAGMIVAFFGFTAGFIFFKTTKGDQKKYIPAGAIMFGHAGWYLFSIVALGAEVPNFGFALPEALLCLAASCVLVYFPHLILILTFTVYHVVLGVMSINALTIPNLEKDMRVALVLHLFLRLGALIAMYSAWITILLENKSATKEKKYGEDVKPKLPKTNYRLPIGIGFSLIFISFNAYFVFVSSIQKDAVSNNNTQPFPQNNMQPFPQNNTQFLPQKGNFSPPFSKGAGSSMGQIGKGVPFKK
jgi:hypothetical protein